ncbi:MAG: hypothetical protein OXK81_06620, partial [Chloroflexota bacterium]|nr:hypothetical protein [Chloroflexota bacterium]
PPRGRATVYSRWPATRARTLRAGGGRHAPALRFVEETTRLLFYIVDLLIVIPAKAGIHLHLDIRQNIRRG